MDIAVKIPSLAFYLTCAGTELPTRPKVWRKRHLITRSAPPRLGYVATAFTDELGRDSRSNAHRQQQQPASHPPFHQGVPCESLDMEDVLICAETYQRSTSEKHRLQILEQVQRAVRHEALTSPPEPQSSTSSLFPMATTPMEAVYKPTADKWTQTEQMMFHLPLTPDTPTNQQSDISILQQQHHDSSTPVLLGHIYPPFNCKTIDWTAKDCYRAANADDVPVTKETFNHRLSPQPVHNADMEVSEIKDSIEIKSTADDKASSTCLTPQTKHFHTGNIQTQTAASHRVTQTDTETSDSGDNATVIVNKKQVSFTRRFSENNSESNNCLLFSGQPSTPLFFTNLEHMQWKIAIGQVDRKIYMNRCKQEPTRIRSTISAKGLFSWGQYIS